ncbi:uncharacterized protein LOC142974241 isoform X2 [Anticarsia gemmatalis]|uniref:uncharacterized protein LOC142974241 isoform X2 n=1 Tax=Anticarsia gemmatalis TaxID=129554 RepID=UPI003F75E574
MTMKHILEFDWNTPAENDEDCFLDEDDVDNSNIEKILRNKFIDPMLSDEEEEPQPNNIDWDQVFKHSASRTNRIFVPGLRAPPPYPKISTLTTVQHVHGLKIMCAKHPNILDEVHLPMPTKVDHRTFESYLDKYKKEQKEYIEWAKSLWTSDHCIRALRPKPSIESIYEAEFKIRAQRLSGFPKHFDMAAQIPLECSRPYKYELTLKDTLLGVNIAELPQAQIPDRIVRNSTIIRPCSMPEPCQKHPYQFILPTEDSVSILPITELHRELAQYAASHGTQYICSENALRCLLEFNRHWTLPLAVHSAINADGECVNVVVLDSEFSVHKEPATTRTYRAFRHLLEHALIPSSEIQKALERNKRAPRKRKRTTSKPPDPSEHASSDDEPLSLYIDDDDDDEDAIRRRIIMNARYMLADDSYLSDNAEPGSDKTENKRYFESIANASANKIRKSDITMNDINKIIGVYNCTCSDTLYEIPPRRSFKKWRVSNINTNDNIDFIVHTAHKARNRNTEILLEPHPEYQLELGASEQPPDKVRRLALSLMLRKNTTVLNVRVDGVNGDMVTTEQVSAEEFLIQHEDKAQQVVNVLHTALSELQGLLPGNYVLQHEPSHGANAFLLVSRPRANTLVLDFDSTQLTESDEAKMVKIPPVITTALLPYHKHRRTLPCAFTPFENLLLKDKKKAPARQKTPPQAIMSGAGGPAMGTKWPKKNRKKNKKKK